MEKTKAFLEAHYKRYILTICLLWFLMFFLPWDWQIGGVSVYYFVMKKLFVVFGVLSILYSVLIKKISLLIFGIIFCLAFWINLFWYFGILPVFLGKLNINKWRTRLASSPFFFLIKIVGDIKIIFVDGAVCMI